jgi:hypothetical protein
MKRKELLNALLSVKPGIASKEIVESMTYFFFSGEAVISYNDVISILYPLKTDFKTFVKADDFFKVVSKVKADSFAFKLEDNQLKMKSDKMLNSFATIYDEEIVSRINTVQESIADATLKKLPAEFVEAVNLCIQVASKNESDQMLTCLYVSGKDVVATDNVRIAHYKMKTAMDEIMIKASELRALVSISPTKYAVTQSWIHFKNDDGCIFSIRRVKGTYPDMLKYMQFDGIDVTLPQGILDGVDVAAVFTETEDDPITVTIKKGKYRIYKESDAGKIDFRDTIDYKGQDITFKINPNLLKEMMKHSTNVVIGVRSARLEADNFMLVTSLFGE